ncbi:Zn-ribbon domain-containing OB-fold protein [Teichococcus oryzae]|uniref:Zn-ribbon domain-containing OB-fold protein n=1 Tax=Teichococcus oryzae TaxID=1608942 RepID=A0A5B2TIX7_9PROT|nr:Zn-ribbon domain-containing OB-fold protein [Pseudoroseomonas oryzae]KAA2214054.1 Zn-ribbon domain-containing OB-fold protein [Pseudoroseomonas oryzae]
MGEKLPHRTPPAPTPDPSTRAFWDAAREGKLLIGRNTKTGKAHYPPRPVCPFDDEGEVEYVAASGRGSLYTYSHMHAKTPYVIAYVELEEGPRIMTNIVDCDPTTLRVGQKVRLVFVPSEGEGQPIPMFTPAEENPGHAHA